MTDDPYKAPRAYVETRVIRALPKRFLVWNIWALILLIGVFIYASTKTGHLPFGVLASFAPIVSALAFARFPRPWLRRTTMSLNGLLSIFSFLAIAGTAMSIFLIKRDVGLVPIFHPIALVIVAFLNTVSVARAWPNNSFKPKPLRGSA
jgi:hypothetical protein